MPPVITRDLEGQTGFENAPYPLSISVDGSLPMSYQWSFNGVVVPGATNSSFDLPRVRLNDQGSYQVIVSNSFGTAISSEAFLDVVTVSGVLNTNLVWAYGGDAPWRSTSLCSDRLCLVARSGMITNGQSSKLQTVVTGPATLTFYWNMASQSAVDSLSFSVNGIVESRIFGPNNGNSETHYLAAGTQVLEWTFTKNSAGTSDDSGWISPVNVKPEITLPKITTSPRNQPFASGSSAAFTVSATGTPPLRYQWQHDGYDIPGATNTTLVIENERSEDVGIYRAIVRNPYGLAAVEANLFVYAGPSQPRDVLDRWYLHDTNQFNKVRFAGGRFFALGNNGLLKTSVDGINWIQADSGTLGNLCGVAFSSMLSRYVAVGSHGALVISTNGTNWTPLSVTAQDLTDIACKGGVFVALSSPFYGSGGPNFFYSLDGARWSSIMLTSSGYTVVPNMTAITVSGDYFVAAGGTPFALDLWRSLDGKTWTRSVNTDEYVTGIASGGGKTVVIGMEGWPWISINQGASWNVVPIPAIVGSVPMIGYDITYGNGLFVVASSGGGLLVMDPAYIWTTRDPLRGGSFSSVAFGNNTFVAIAGGTYPAGIYQSDSILYPRMSTQYSNSNMAISAAVQVGISYRLQTSTNLVHWSDWLNFTNGSGAAQAIITNSPSGPMKFYRIVGP